ncbi:MAG TPA: N-acetylmuramoyl-L-alanine amidase, partial [Nitrolancea sp.]|nr:N-acetylmuramoyl-L-alanine amidase [Nitrolancea sp.]
GVDNGATGTTIDGETVYEKTIALALAQRTATKLRAAGYKVVLSRTTDALPGLLASDLTPDGQSLTDQGVLNDLQRRIDRANASGAKFLLSIHLNANDDPSVSGTTTYYDSTRTFAAANLQFAQLVQTDLISGLRAKGYTTPDLGVLDDTDLDGNDLGVLPGTYNHLVLLGPASPGQLRPSLMPGALNESLFLSNVSEATAATQAAMQDLLASGYARAISHSFSR